MDRRRWPRLSELALAAAGFALALVVLDRMVAWTGLGYEAARARPNEDRRLIRDEFDVRVVTNALGFRDARLPAPKPAGTVRVVALGDSFTQGYGVEEAETYSRRLESLLAARQPDRRVEVVNLGVPGTSPRDYVGHLRDPGLGYEPDLVLIGVMANDVQDVWIQRRFGVRFAAEVLRDVQRDLTDERPLWRRAPAIALPALYPFVWTRAANALGALRSPAHAASGRTAPTARRPMVAEERWRDVVLAMGDRFGRRAETSAALAGVSAERAAAIEPVATGAVSLDSEAGIDGYLALLAVVEPRLLADTVLLPAAYDDAWRETEGYLRAMAGMARRAGGRAAIVYIPAIHQVTDAGRATMERAGFVWDPRTLVDTTLPDRLRRLAAAEEMPVVDLLPAFRAARGRNLYYVHDGHWTAAGHELAARTIADALGPIGR